MQQVISSVEAVLQPLLQFLGLVLNGEGYRSQKAVHAAVAQRALVCHSDANLRRLSASLQRDAVQQLRQIERAFRSLSDSDVAVVVAQLQKARQQIREETRRGLEDAARVVLAAAEERHSFAWGFESPEHGRALTDVINAARGKSLDTWVSILSGDVGISDAAPSSESGLLLQTLGRPSAMQCLEHWSRIRGGERNLKTFEKYRVVALDLEALLGGQSVLALEPHHIQLYAEYLRARGNSVKTVHDKLTNCTTLLRSWDLPEATKRALVEWRPRKGDARKRSAPRSALSEGQLGDFLAYVFNDRTLPPDDRVVVALQALSGARLEEICSLRGEQVHYDGTNWVLDFAESDVLRLPPASRRVSAKPTQLKCADSVRKVPVIVSVVHGLHERLLALKAQTSKGLLFQHLSVNMYGIYSGALSMRVNRRMDDVLGEDRRLVLESLRNTAAPTLRRAKVDDYERRSFMGHAPSNIHERHYDVLTVDDLLEPAQAVSRLVAKSLQGRAYPPLHRLYTPKRLTRAERKAVATQDFQVNRPGI